jgi:3-hydroxybutyryl-CoA dehydratase
MEPGKSIQELHVGDAVVMTKKILDEDIRLFAKVSGDENPIHLDEAYAATTRFKHRIAHGHYVASMFSTLLGTQLPGQGSIYLSQSIKYMAPVYMNDEIKAEVKVVEINEERNRVTLETTAFNQDGTVVVKGVAEIMPPKGQSNVK